MSAYLTFTDISTARKDCLLVCMIMSLPGWETVLSGRPLEFPHGPAILAGSAAGGGQHEGMLTCGTTDRNPAATGTVSEQMKWMKIIYMKITGSICKAVFSGGKAEAFWTTESIRNDCVKMVQPFKWYYSLLWQHQQRKLSQSIQMEK